MANKPAARDEFLPTLGRCILGMIIAALLGCFIGYGVLVIIGQDTDMTVSDGYLDRASASRSGFVAQNLEYQQAADALRNYPGIKVLRTASGEPFYWLDGQKIDPLEIMDSAFAEAIETLFQNSAEALCVESATTEELIQDMLLYNIAVDEHGNVYYYLYYDQYGYICIAYDEQNSCAEEAQFTLMDQWYIFMDYGALDT